MFFLFRWLPGVLTERVSGRERLTTVCMWSNVESEESSVKSTSGFEEVAVNPSCTRSVGGEGGDMAKSWMREK